MVELDSPLHHDMSSSEKLKQREWDPMNYLLQFGVVRKEQNSRLGFGFF